MEDKIVLICAVGRSGSTTMQRILNTIPNSNICGENYAAINSLLEFYIRLKETTDTQVPGRTTPFTYEYLIEKKFKPCWYNSYHIVEITKKIKEMIISMFKINEMTNVWGFKEIRYENGNIKYLTTFKELFPQTKVIIQIRENIVAQSKSGWFKHDTNAINFLKKTNKELHNFYIKNNNFCYLTSFERMFNRKNLKKMFSFIGCEEHYNEEKITEVLENNIKD
jgi:hypothetical protein